MAGSVEVRERMKIYTPKFLVRRFNRKVRRNREKYKELDRALLGARLPVTLQNFLAVSSFYSYFSFVIGAAIGVFLVSQVPPDIILDVSRPTPLYDLVVENFHIVSRYYVLIGLVLGLITLKLVRYLILSYPFFIANRRKSEIDLYTPHAINMMYGMTVGGTPPYEAIKTIAESKHLFGELSREFGIIVEMVEVFRRDIYDAMRFVRDTTPSPRLAAFLDNFIFVLQGGGKVSEFLKMKSEEYMEEQETTFGSIVEFMGFTAEIYLALFILLPLFLLIIFVVTRLMSQTYLEAYRNIILAVLPVSTYMLIWLVRSVIPSPKVRLEAFEEGYEVIKANTVDEERKSFKVRRFKKVANRIKSFLLHPFRESIYTIQFRIVFFHIFLFAFLVLFLTYRYFSLEITAIAFISAIILPLIILVEIRERTLRKAEENIPNVFAELAVLNEAGLSIFEGLKMLSAMEMGILTKEISVLRKELEWGVLMPRTFIRMGLRLKSDVMAKVIPVVVKALETAPTIKDAFTVVAKYAESEVRFKRKMRNSMQVYVAIIYLSIGVFLFVSYMIIKNFLSVFAGVSVELMGGVTTLNLDLIKMTFFQVTFTVAVLSGLIAGNIGEGKVVSGIKHSYVFAVATYLLFFHLL